MALTGKVRDLEALYNNEDTPALQRGVAKYVFTAVRDGNWTALATIMERTIGKVPDKIAFTNPEGDESRRVIEFVKSEKK